MLVKIMKGIYGSYSDFFALATTELRGHDMNSRFQDFSQSFNQFIESNRTT